MIIAARLERFYTKDEIVALYLNRYDFLNQAVGVKSAANIYFDKDVSELELHESAMLVGMLKNSSLFNPLRRPELVLNRRNVVFGQMQRYGRITDTEADSLRALPLGLNYQKVSHDEGLAPYFREALRAELKELFGAKDAERWVLAKADGARPTYRDGIGVRDPRQSAAGPAETAVQRHLGEELQATLSDLRREAGICVYRYERATAT